MTTLSPQLGDPIPNAVFPTAGQGLTLDLSGRLPSSLVNPARVTVFPSLPVDGYEVVYTADATNGIQWRFKYNANSASASKWELIGGRPLMALVATLESTTSSTYTALATPGPSIILPFAGDWDIAIGAYIDPALNGTGRMSYDIGGTGAGDSDCISEVAAGAAQAGTGHRWREKRQTGLSAGTVTAKYKSPFGAISVGFQDRCLSAIPVRVTG